MKVVYVDGFKIRQTLDTDFCVVHFRHKNNVGSPDFRWYIPEGELWFDHVFKEETEFIVAVETAEMADRSREAYRARFVKAGKPADFVVREEKHDGLTIKYVKGKLVREYLDPLFFLGGHDLVYPSYIPRGEVWLDNRMDSRDKPHVLKHELFERKLMSEGKIYDIAHDYATAAERESRRHAGAIYVADANHSGKLDLTDYYVR